MTLFHILYAVDIPHFTHKVSKLTQINGPYSATDTVGCFQQNDVINALIDEQIGRSNGRNARTNDYNPR